MRIRGYWAVAILAAGFAQPAWAVDCRPHKSDVVGLGQQSARGHAERALRREIEAEKSSATAAGGQIVRVTKPVITCKPFPNLLAADEWECIGEAKVCVKLD